MPRITTSLTVKQINSPAKKSATNSKPDRIADGKGLWIYKYPSGKKTWYARYTVKGTGSQKALLIGDYPDITLADARLKNGEIKKIAKSGIDPKLLLAEQAKQTESQITFKALAEDWLELRKLEDKQDSEHIRRLDANILPVIGNMPFTTIKKSYLQDEVIDPIIARDAYHEADRNQTTLKLILEHGIDKYDLDITNPANKLKYPKLKSGHFNALTNEPDVRQLVKDIWSYREKHPRSSIHVEHYLKLAIMLFIRPSELREMTWDSYDHSSSTLSYTISKTDTEHTIILPTQARSVFESLIKDKRSKYIFPTHLTGKVQPISDNVARVALNRLGYEGKQTIHGFRATARTLLDERLNQDIRYIENQLGHVPRDLNGKAYNRTQYVAQRKDLLQLWADYLDALRKDEDIEQFIKKNVK